MPTTSPTSFFASIREWAVDQAPRPVNLPLALVSQSWLARPRDLRGGRLPRLTKNSRWRIQSSGEAGANQAPIPLVRADGLPAVGLVGSEEALYHGRRKGIGGMPTLGVLDALPPLTSWRVAVMACGRALLRLDPLRPYALPVYENGALGAALTNTLTNIGPAR
jgi:hypothetical protein